MLYGFLGFEPTPEGFKIHPRLPKGWPEAMVTRVHLHDLVLDVRAKADGTITIESQNPSDLPVVIELPEGTWKTDAEGATIEGSSAKLRLPGAPVTFTRAK
jgi:hypothetical protein